VTAEYLVIDQDDVVEVTISDVVVDYVMLAGPEGPPGEVGATGATGTTDWAGITGKPSTFTPSTHSHTESDVTGLTTDLAAKEPTITAGTTGQYWRGDKSWQTLDKTAVSLGNVDNTSDANKPVSTATTTALALKANLAGTTTFTGTVSATNPRWTSPLINQILDDNGLPIISLGATASAVNNVQVFNSATAVAPSVRAIGSDTNISLNLVSKGTGLVMANGQIVLTQNMPVSLDYYFTANGMKFNSVADPSGYSLFIGTSATGTPANYFNFTNAISGAAPSLSAVGTDINISLNFNAKGTGTVQANGNPVVVNVAVPATATSAGVAGQHAYDSSYVYVCTATDTWKRAALSTW